MNNNKKSGGIFGKGYYIALILCAAAIGISGYVYYRNASRTEEVLQQNETGVQVAVVATEEDIPAAVTRPVTQPVETTATTPTVKKALKTASPLEGETVAVYAMDCLSYNSTTRDWRVHDGIDIAAAAGTAVKAAADGQVYTVCKDDTMGTMVVIRHEDGYVTVYASLAEEVAVSAGDQVKLGQTIGTVGETALLENALGEHLHFAVLCNDEQMDPAEFLSLAS